MSTEILVNAGADLLMSPIHELDLRAWDASMEVNLRAPALLCAAVLPAMRERKRGYIINIASEAGVFVYGGMGPYAVSKHALRVLTELIQEENQDFGIKAWAICPGFVPTPMTASHQFDMPWLMDADRAAKHIAWALANRCKPVCVVQQHERHENGLPCARTHNCCRIRHRGLGCAPGPH